jgi:hypothetical protein
LARLQPSVDAIAASITNDKIQLDPATLFENTGLVIRYFSDIVEGIAEHSPICIASQERDRGFSLIHHSLNS